MTTLRALTEKLFADDELATVLSLVNEQGLYENEKLLSFDRSLGGPGLHNINRGTDHVGASGRYEFSDRDIFRPIQYCAWWFAMKDPHDVLWLSRSIVHMSGLHIEGLLKRMTFLARLPYGQLLSKPIVKQKLGSDACNKLSEFLPFYNASKHEIAPLKDSHLFSLHDAVLAYFISRRLASLLYRHVRLSTDMRSWADDQE